MDSDYFDAGTYAAGDLLTAKNGKFSAAGTSKVIGRVLNYDATNGRMRLMWFAAR